MTTFDEVWTIGSADTEDPAFKAAFKEKHYRILGRILAASMRNINGQVRPEYHDSVHRACAIMVENMMGELAKDNPRFDRGKFLAAIKEAT